MRICGPAIRRALGQCLDPGEAVAQAALDAREFAIAHGALAPLMNAPTRRVAMLVAKLAELEGDEGRAREWTARALHARRDPSWTADGLVSDRWMPVSPATGRLDAFQWKEPVAELGGKIIEDGGAPAVTEAAAPAERLPPPAVSIEAVPARSPSAPEPAPAEIEAPAPSGAAGPIKPLPASASFEKVVPLHHAPDDPGPEGEPPAEPPAEAPLPASNGWGRLRALFK
jgi:HemY protein